MALASDVPATLKDVQLTKSDSCTLVNITVKATYRVYHAPIFINPLADATLRDEFGNEYKPLGIQGKDTLTGKIGGDLTHPGQRTGTLIFPALKNNPKIVSILLLVHREKTMAEGLSGNDGDIFTLSEVINLEQK